MNNLTLVLLLTPTAVLAADLSPEMVPIAHLESANGVLLDHQPSPRGPFWTAFGPLGLKPSTAYDEYKLSPRLQRTFPTQGEQDFLEQFTHNTTFYYALAAQHWAKLKRLAGGNLVRAAFGWHWGQTRLLKARAEHVAADEYAQKYARLSAPLLASK
jgi:hypothetical protein